MAQFKDEHPIKFNNTVIPFMSGWDETYEVVENVYQTEAGTDDIDVTRYGKLTVSCQTTCLYSVLQTLISFASLPSFTLKKFNPIDGEDEERTVRMRDLKYSLKEKSWDLEENGIWSVSFTLKEF